MSRYRRRVIETFEATRAPGADGQWRVTYPDGSVHYLDDAQFNAEFTVDDTGLGTHLNQITLGNR